MKCNNLHSFCHSLYRSLVQILYFPNSWPLGQPISQLRRVF
jgi:hypothetical protein